VVGNLLPTGQWAKKPVSLGRAIPRPMNFAEIASNTFPNTGVDRAEPTVIQVWGNFAEFLISQNCKNLSRKILSVLKLLNGERRCGACPGRSSSNS
jgi:hypothetical protein